MTKTRQGSGAGFTLIELLVVSAIIGVVVTVVAACLAGGIRVWDRTRTLAVTEANAVIGLRIIEKDLANTFAFYGIRFDGGPAGLSFPGLVLPRPAGSDKSQDSDTGERIGMVKYWFDPQKKALFRQEKVYPCNEASPVVAEELLPHLQSLALQYYAPARQGLGGAWQGSWDDETNFPSRVRVQLVFEQEEGVVNISRTILLPTEKVQNSRKK